MHTLEEANEVVRKQMQEIESLRETLRSRGRDKQPTPGDCDSGKSMMAARRMNSHDLLLREANKRLEEAEALRQLHDCLPRVLTDAADQALYDLIERSRRR